MKKRTASRVAVLIALMVVSCTAPAPMLDIPAATELMATRMPSPTSTAVFVPTVDPRTPTAIAAIFKTLEANQIPTLEATAASTYEECNENLFFMQLGSWALCHGLQDPITLVSRSGQSWEFSYSNYYGTKVPNPCTRLLYLTDDQKYLYFSLDAECQLVEPGFLASIAVFRMNLEDGYTIGALQGDYDFGSDRGSYYMVSVSPTGRRLAYLFNKERPLQLHVLDLQTGENTAFALDEKFIFGGNYHWSADGTKLAFMLESEDNFEYFISISYMDLLKENSLVTFISGRDYRWIMAEMKVSDAGVTISMQDEDPLFYDTGTGVLSTIAK